MTPVVSRKKRLNIRAEEWIKNEIKVMAAEIDPDRPRIQDVLEVAIYIRRHDPRLWRVFVERLLAEKPR